MNKQHYQLPNSMRVTAKDKYVYLMLKFYDGKEGCFPTLETLSKNFGLDTKTIRTSINRLEKAGYIQIEQRGRKNYYHFTMYLNFEPFSPEFMKSKEIPTGVKIYIAGIQQYMYKDVENLGKLSYTDCQIAKLLGMSQPTVNRYHKKLKELGILYMMPSKKKDQVTGCKSNIKLFKMDKLHQQIIWTLKEHEERLDEYGASITKLEKDNNKHDVTITKLEENNNKHDAAIAKLEKEISELKKRNSALEKSKKETDKFISKFVEEKITEEKEKEKQRKEQLLIILE